MPNLFGEDEKEKKPKAEKVEKEPFDLDKRLAEIRSQPKNSAKMGIFIPPVSWYGMYYQTIIDQELIPAVDKHLQELDETEATSRDYRKYLVNHCNFPKDYLLKEER